MSRGPVAIAIDLGSTRIKTATLDENGLLGQVVSRPAPPLDGPALERVGDPLAYAAVADELLQRMTAAHPGTPVGIACQRSTFLLWDRSRGVPLTPLISWQDRRASGWCDRHRDLEPAVARRTGLLLSAHYVGPKLATMQESDPALGAALRNGSTLFGNLESYLIWCWTSGRVHQTDPTMAARTSMFDLEHGRWSTELLAAFDVPAKILPEIVATAGRAVQLDSGLRIAASVADQAAGALAVLAPGREDLLITLGTGAFVLRACRSPARQPGYLLAPILGSQHGIERFVIEGTVNGAGAAVDHVGGPPLRLDEQDPTPDRFCLPDIAGLGSPDWRPEIGLTFSREPAGTTERRRLVLEGLLFRLRETVDDLDPNSAAGSLLLAGGLSRVPILAEGLAALLDRAVEIVVEREAGLIGAGRLAAGLPPFASPRTSTVPAPGQGSYLRSKYERWKRFKAALLSGSR